MSSDTETGEGSMSKNAVDRIPAADNTADLLAQLRACPADVPWTGPDGLFARAADEIEHLMAGGAPTTREGNAYTVVADADGCAHCGHGALWTVQGPTGICHHTSYDDADDASVMARDLNDAYEAGYAAASKPT